MTGAREVPLSLISFLSLLKFLICIALVYVAFNGFSVFLVPAAGASLTVVKTFDSLRFNIIRSSYRAGRVVSASGTIMIFFLQDLLIAGILFGLGAGAAKVFN